MTTMMTSAFAPRLFTALFLAAAATAYGQNQGADDYNTRSAKMKAAVQQESQRHQARLAAIEKETVDAQTAFRNDLVNCAGNSGCVTAAHRRLDAKMRQIQIERNNEDATHAKNMIDIPQKFGFKDIYDTRGCPMGGGVPCKNPCQNES
jgi:hypothetical protein